MSKLSHIGIAVTDLENSIEVFSEIFGCAPETVVDVTDQQVKVAIFRPGGKNSAAIELICPTSENSPISKYLKKRGEGLHHISLGVSNLVDKLNDLKNKNFKLIDDSPRDGTEGKKIAFVHPKSTSGVLLELEEE